MNIAGWILSIGGYLVGFYFAILFKQSDGDILAIAVESNIPNEGKLCIFQVVLLSTIHCRFLMKNNNKFLFCVLSALGSTVLPMTIHYIINRFRDKKAEMMDDTDSVCKRSSVTNSV